MTTLIISVSSSALNAGTSTFGQQTDAGAPSFYDMHVTGSTNPLIPNGVYDAYCIDPTLGIRVEPRTFNADSIEASTNGSFQQIKPTDVNYNALTQVQVDKLNWLLSQNFTSDPKYAGKYNYGEIQTAIWRILGFSQATIDSEGFGRFLSDNNRNTVASADIDFLLSAANNAVTIGHYVSPPPGTNRSGVALEPGERTPEPVHRGGRNRHALERMDRSEGGAGQSEGLERRLIEGAREVHHDMPAADDSESGKITGR